MNPGKERVWLLLLVGGLALAAVWTADRRDHRFSDVVAAAWKPGGEGKKVETVPPEGPVLDLQESFAKVAERVKPTVVSITATHIETVQAPSHEFFFGDPFEEFFREFQGMPRRNQQQPQRGQPRQFQRRQQGMGSGVIVDPRGYVLTNEHVVRGADELTVTIQDPEEKKYAGKVVGADPRTDLAVVKITPQEPLVFAALGDSDRVRVGDWAIAIGSPFGLRQTLTVGVISALGQSLAVEGVNYSGLLQTDAAINRGNSGGPLVNIRGEVIGINTAIFAPTGVFAGIGFAIPVNRVKDIMDQLIEKGRVVRGWLGVEILSVNEVMAKQFGLAKAEGVVVNGVQPGSPAEKGGLKRGDVIVSFNGKPTPTQEILVENVGKTPPKTKVKMGIIRDGKSQELSITTAEMPSDPSAESDARSGETPGDPKSGETRWEGARLSDATPVLLNRYGLSPGSAGVLVVDVEGGGLAERLGLAEGDLIASFNRQKTANVADFKAASKKTNPKDGVLLDVNRQGRWMYLSFREGQ